MKVKSAEIDHSELLDVLLNVDGCYYATSFYFLREALGHGDRVIILCNMISMRDKLRREKTITKEDEFYYFQSSASDRVRVPLEQIKRHIRWLIDNEWLFATLRTPKPGHNKYGDPKARRYYYKVNEPKIIKALHLYKLPPSERNQNSVGIKLIPTQDQNSVGIKLIPTQESSCTLNNTKKKETNSSFTKDVKDGDDFKKPKSLASSQRTSNVNTKDSFFCKKEETAGNVNIEEGTNLSLQKKKASLPEKNKTTLQEKKSTPLQRQKLTLPPARQRLDLEPDYPSVASLTPPVLPPKKHKPLHVSQRAEAIINTWEGLGLRKCDRTKKPFAAEIRTIEKLLDGTFFNNTESEKELKNSPISDKQLTLAIQRFASAALDPDYEPANPESKKKLRRMSIDIFAYNPWSDNGHKSQLTKYFLAGPKKLEQSITPKKDLYPEWTELLLSAYRKRVLPGYKPEPLDRNRFVDAARELEEFWVKHPKLQDDLVLDLYHEWKPGLVKALFVAMKKLSGWKGRIEPSWFSRGIKVDLPRYLHDVEACGFEKTQEELDAEAEAEDYEDDD